MRAVADARAIERGAVTAAVRNVVPDASDDEILQATMICLVRAMAEDD